MGVVLNFDMWYPQDWKGNPVNIAMGEVCLWSHQLEIVFYCQK